jgi:hypothetical protein
MHPSGPLRLPSPRTSYERRLSFVRPSLVAVMPSGMAAKATAFRLVIANGHDRVGFVMFDPTLPCSSRPLHVRSDICLFDSTFDCPIQFFACPTRSLLVRSVPCMCASHLVYTAPQFTGCTALTPLWVGTAALSLRRCRRVEQIRPPIDLATPPRQPPTSGLSSAAGL